MKKPVYIFEVASCGPNDVEHSEWVKANSLEECFSKFSAEHPDHTDIVVYNQRRNETRREESHRLYREMIERNKFKKTWVSQDIHSV